MMPHLSDSSCSTGAALFVPVTGSTSSDMKVLAAEGAAEGLWLRAGKQTAGKGRLGRQWEGQEGNFFASTLVRLSASDPLAPTLALVAAVAVHQALAVHVGDQTIRLKWPNDIMAGRAKLCGMLLERVEDAVIVGIGVNITSAPDMTDRQTTCLRALGADVDAPTLLSDIATCFSAALARWRTLGVEAMVQEWQHRAHPAGTALSAQDGNGERIEGHFVGLNRDGALILRLADSRCHVIHAGDVFLI